MFRLVRSSAAFGISLLLLTATACGSDDDSSSATTAAPGTTAAAETTAAAAETTAAPAPESTAAPETTAAETTTAETAAPVDVAEQIVSLSPTHTEMLFAIGAGDQVIAVDDQSNYPPEAEAVRTDLSGFNPNVEAIASYEPDLVVIGDDFNGLTEQLGAVDIPVWSGPSAMTLDDTYTQIEQLGALTGHVAEAAELVAQMETDIEAILTEVPEAEVPLTYYHELDNTFFTVTSNTFIGQLYSLAGLQNIADLAEVDTPYPQLNAEFIISSNPELIFLADTKCCGESAETVAARDGWGEIAAVQNAGVIEMDDDIASRWGPRVVDYLRAIVDAVIAQQGVPAG